MMSFTILHKFQPTPPFYEKGHNRHSTFTDLHIAFRPAWAHAKPDPTIDLYPRRFGKGQDYLKMSENEKRAYAKGAVNGMSMAPFFDAPEKSTKWLEDYLKGVSDVQLAAIITKYLKDNPELWHLGLNALTYNAIWEAYQKTYQ